VFAEVRGRVDGANWEESVKHLSEIDFTQCWLPAMLPEHGSTKLSARWDAAYRKVVIVDGDPGCPCMAKTALGWQVVGGMSFMTIVDIETLIRATKEVDHFIEHELSPPPTTEKAFRLEVLIIDHDHIGRDEIISALENARYPNRCISPDVMSVEERDIGEWTDDHPLNDSRRRSEFERLFKS
jgi:hypothetical protein